MKPEKSTLSRKNTLEQMKNKEREDRKNLIIDAAEHVFASKAFDKVSMREIAEQAGIATSSIYTYFPTQESLFLEAVLRDSNRLLDEIQRMIDASEGKSNIERAIDAFIEFISHNDSYYRMMVVFMTQGNLTSESMEKLNSVVRRGYEMFDGVFIRAGYAGDVRMLSHYFFAMLNGILVTFRKFPGREDDEIIAHMKKISKIFTQLLAGKP